LSAKGIGENRQEKQAKRDGSFHGAFSDIFDRLSYNTFLEAEITQAIETN